MLLEQIRGKLCFQINTILAYIDINSITFQFKDLNGTRLYTSLNHKREYLKGQ